MMARNSSSETTLRISLLGSARVLCSGVDTSADLTRGIQPLLGYLLIQRRCLSRELLAAVFWGEQSQDRARASLNTALWRLRRALEPFHVPRGTYLRQHTNGDISFNGESSYWFDVEILHQAGADLSNSKGVVLPTVVDQLETAVSLYSGDFLEGCYSDWVLEERDRLKSLYLNCLTSLVHYHAEHGDAARAIHWGQAAIASDPSREDIHQQLMRLYVGTGQRTTALRQYDKCRRALATELDVAPSTDTVNLYEMVKSLSAQSQFSRSNPCLESLPDSLEAKLLQSLLDARRQVDDIANQLKRAIELLSPNSDPYR